MSRGWIKDEKKEKKGEGNIKKELEELIFLHHFLSLSFSFFPRVSLHSTLGFPFPTLAHSCILFTRLSASIVIFSRSLRIYEFASFLLRAQRWAVVQCAPWPISLFLSFSLSTSPRYYSNSSYIDGFLQFVLHTCRDPSTRVDRSFGRLGRSLWFRASRHISSARPDVITVTAAVAAARGATRPIKIKSTSH